MWNASRERFDRVERVLIEREHMPVSVAEFYGALRQDVGARDVLLEALRRSPFDAFFWETPPVARATAGRPFEFVTIPAPGLARTAADPRAFDAPFADLAATTPAVFQNLSGDALLIAPRPVKNFACYNHIAAFVRHANPMKQHDLLIVLSQTVMDAISERSLWVSTCGLGVPWLHVRLDRWPKYYAHQPYRTPSSADD